MTPTKRIDHKRASIVDHGISLDEEKGAVIAWAYLIKNGVSEDVIMRVLSTPASSRPRVKRNSGMSLLCASTVNPPLQSP